MSSSRRKHRNEEDCECDCHHCDNKLEYEDEVGYEGGFPKERIRKNSLQKAKKTYETVNNSLASTNTMASYGNKLRQQPQSSKALLNRRDCEEQSGDYEDADKSIPTDNGRNSLTYQMKYERDELEKYDQLNTYENRSNVEGEGRRRDYEQMAFDLRSFEWENANLTYKLEKALKEKRAAIAMSNSLKRILDDYSNKTSIKGEEDALKNLCVDEANHLRESNRAYEAMMDHTFDFLRFLANKEGIEMKPINYYLHNDDNLYDLLEDIHQSLKNSDKANCIGKRSDLNQMSQFRLLDTRRPQKQYDGYEEEQYNHHPKSYEEDDRTGHFAPAQSLKRDYPESNQHAAYASNNKQTFGMNQYNERDSKADVNNSRLDNSIQNNERQQEYQRERSDNEDNEEDLNDYYRRQRPPNEANANQNEPYQRPRSHYEYKDQQLNDYYHRQRAPYEENENLNELYRKQRSYHGENNNFEETDPRQKHKSPNNENNENLYEELEEEQQSEEVLNDKSYQANKPEQIFKLAASQSVSNTNDRMSNKANSTLKKANLVFDPNEKSEDLVEHDVPLPNTAKKLKGKTALLKEKSPSPEPKLKIANFVNIKSFDKSSSKSLKEKLQPNYPKITEDSNSNINTNENPIKSKPNIKSNNNINIKLQKTPKEDMVTSDLKKYKSRFNNEDKSKKDLKLKPKTTLKDKLSAVSLENDLKRSDSLKLPNKTQSTIEVKMEYNPKESTSSSPATIKKAKTYFNAQRIQSPLRKDICIACSVDCNISSNGYSPMTFIPYGGKVLRKSVTPVVYPL